MRFFTTLLLMVALLGAFGCQSKAEGEGEAAAVSETEEAVEAEAVEEPEIIAKESGVRYQELVVGEGVEAVDRMPVDIKH